MTLFVELENQHPPLDKEVEKGFISLKKMLRMFLDEGMELGYLKKEMDASAVSEMLFSSMLETATIYGTEKIPVNLDVSINSLVNYLHRLRSKTSKRNCPKYA